MLDVPTPTPPAGAVRATRAHPATGTARTMRARGRTGFLIRSAKGGIRNAEGGGRADQREGRMLGRLVMSVGHVGWSATECSGVDAKWEIRKPYPRDGVGGLFPCERRSYGRRHATTHRPTSFDCFWIILGIPRQSFGLRVSAGLGEAGRGEAGRGEAGRKVREEPRLGFVGGWAGMRFVQSVPIPNTLFIVIRLHLSLYWECSHGSAYTAPFPCAPYVPQVHCSSHEFAIRHDRPAARHRAS